MRSFVLLPALVVCLGAGCCLESSINSGASGVSGGASSGGASSGASSAGASGSSTGGSSGAASTSSSGGSSGGNTTGTGGLFLGAIEAEGMTLVSPGTDAGTVATAIAGIFLDASDWPDCTSDPLTEIAAGSCCFQPASSLQGLNAGVVSVEVDTFDGGSATFAMPFQADGGFYGSENMAYAIGASWSVVGGEADGTVLPLFRVSDFSFFPGPTPVLTPPLAELTSLSTSQDWTVPLTPSEFEFLFVDRVIVEADDVGSVICQTFDEGALMPALVVPAAMLARFEGHQGAVTITRDDYPQWIDAGAVLLSLRLGVGARTEANEVSFGP